MPIMVGGNGDDDEKKEITPTNATKEKEEEEEEKQNSSFPPSLYFQLYLFLSTHIQQHSHKYHIINLFSN